MKFGAVLPSSAGHDVPDPDDLWRFAEAAERLRLSHLWVSDHILFWHPMYEAATVLSAIAARTQRIRVGTAVMLLAMRNPVIAAKSLATIDRLSKGRLTLGVGIGGEFPPEWDAVGVSHRQRVSRTDEMIEALKGLWGPGAFGYSGKRISFPEVDLTPKPAQDQIPIWIGGRSEASARRAARLGDGWMGIFLTPQKYAERLSLIRQLTDRRIVSSLYVWTFVEDTDAKAKERARNTLSSFYNTAFEKLEPYAIIGSPATCAERFQEYAAAGVQEFAIATVSQAPDVLERLVAEGAIKTESP